MSQLEDEHLIIISALSHFQYCPRRYALIHLEGLWEENRFTVEGEILHERVHRDGHESRKTLREEYSLPVRSLRWGLTGKCDLVEIWYHRNSSVEKVMPVEFKRGRKKTDDVDLVQLCAQVLCLEEMFGITIEQGQFYYLQEHRRTDAAMTEELRKKTVALIDRIREIQQIGNTPAAEYKKRKCDNCSLVDVCMPKSAGSGGKQVARYMQAQLFSVEKECVFE
jgi:CRISPR-associated exonuclease Cas4